MNGIKRIFFSTVFTVSLVGGAFLSLQTQNQNFQVGQSIQEVKEGVNICFSRLQQTYTSVYISPSLAYLSLEFLKTTEACFSQALSAAINSQIENSAEAEKLINRLGNYVRLFHAGIKNKSLFSNGEGDFSVANSRFIKLEETRDEIIERLDVMAERNNRANNNYIVATYGLLTAVIFGLFMIAYYDRVGRDRFRLYREQIIKSLHAGNDQADYGQAYVKAMKFFGISTAANDDISIAQEKISSEQKTLKSDKKKLETRVLDKVNTSAVIRTQEKESIQKEEAELNRPVTVTLGDILGEILLEYSPEILSNKISTKFNEFEEIEFHGNSTRLYHLMKFIFGILVKSEFNGAPYINLEVQKKNGPIIHLNTNSVLSQLDSESTQEFFKRATESFSDDFDLDIVETNKGTKNISIKQKKRLVKLFKGTKKQFLERQNANF